MPPRDLLLALVTMALWGLNFAFAKIALAEFPPILLAALRFAVVAALLLPFCGARPPLKPILLLAAILGLVHFPLVFSGLSRLDASTAAIVLQLQVPFGVALAAVFLGDKFRLRDGLGLIIALAGVALIAGAPRLGASRIGIAMLVVAAFGWGLGTVQLKRLGPISPIVLNAWLGLFLAITLFAISLAVEGSPLPRIVTADWRGWAGMLYTSIVSTIIAFGAWARLVARHPVSRTLPFMLTIPLFAVFGGIALNGDHLTRDIVAGGSLTLAGVAVIVLQRPSRVAAQAEQTG